MTAICLRINHEHNPLTERSQNVWTAGSFFHVVDDHARRRLIFRLRSGEQEPSSTWRVLGLFSLHFPHITRHIFCGMCPQIVFKDSFRILGDFSKVLIGKIVSEFDKYREAAFNNYSAFDDSERKFDHQKNLWWPACGP